MPQHQQQRWVPYTPEQMFDLAADVGRYPEFLPWVIGARVMSRSETAMRADLIVGFKIFREKFTSQVQLERPHALHVQYINGPLRYLRNNWRFESADQGGTTIHFDIAFEFRNILFEKMVGALFSEAVRRMVDAFEQRAQTLYGTL